MNQTELIELVDNHCPEIMQKVAAALITAEKIDPSFGHEMASDISEATHATLEKTSGIVGDYALKAGVAASGALAVALAGDLYDAAKRGLTKATNFKRILATNPSLLSHDKNDLKKHFDTLHRYAPEFTMDPSLGGEALQSMVEMPGNRVNVIKELIQSRKSLKEIKKIQLPFELPKMQANKDS